MLLGLFFAVLDKKLGACYHIIREVNPMKQTLWTKNYTTLIAASTMGCIGNIAGDFAISFLVYDETGSVLASALTFAIGLIPGFVLPLLAAPWMDRLPRKPFLVWDDAIAGVLYLLAGLYLLYMPFTYGGYLVFKLLISSLGAMDSLAYNSIYPKLIPVGMEEKGYAFSASLYSVLQVLIAPLAAVLLDLVGVPVIIIAEGFCCLAAAALESTIELREEIRMDGQRFSLRLWWQDLKEAASYVKKERGLLGIYGYVSLTNGFFGGYQSLWVAFFRTAPGFTAAMYSLFSGVEFIGRSLGGALCYRYKMDPKKKFGYAFFVYQFYDFMDAILLWLPYPLMLANRGISGFLGMISGTLRQAAVQRYIPDHMRARLNALENIMILGASAVLSLAVGLMAEVMDLRVCMSICGLICMAACWPLIWRNRKPIRQIYENDN